MLGEYYKLYMSDTFRFAKLLTLKFDTDPDVINEFIMMNYGKDAVDLNNPASWKYYLNLAGEYHFSDQEMRIFSLDTSEEIIFNKTNLALHTATKQSYQQLSNYYYELVKKYPTQESLIRGILYPVPTSISIPAIEGTILSYPEELIEPQEMTLIQDLQEWIYRYLVRWHIKPFAISDSLYPASMQGVLYANIPSRLLGLRMQRCKTNEAHSFHIRSYLASHGYLHRYFDYLTLKQKLFLYRNILYIERHSGLKEDFFWLIQRLLTERKIPIADFTARQYAGFDKQYYPNYHYRKNPINTEFNVPEKDYFSLEEISWKEYPSAPLNYTYWREHFDEIDLKFKNSGHAVMLTKDLESWLYDYTNSVPYPFPFILLNEWAYRSYTGDYKVLTTIKHPINSVTYTVTSDIAFVYMLYLTLKMNGIEILNLPTFFCNSVLRIPKPDPHELKTISGLYYKDNDLIANWLLQSTPSDSQFYSRKQFHDYCFNLYLARLKHWYLVSNTHSVSERPYVQNMVDRMFMDCLVEYNNTHINPKNFTINDWLRDNDLPLDNFTKEEMGGLVTDIFIQATGYYIDKTKILKFIQQAMIDIMRQLTSYSVQYLSNAYDGEIRPLNWAAIRTGNVDAQVKNTLSVLHLPMVVDSKITSHGEVDYPVQSFADSKAMLEDPNASLLIKRIPDNITYFRGEMRSSVLLERQAFYHQPIAIVIKNIVSRLVIDEDGTAPPWLLTPLTVEQINQLMGE